LDRPRGRRRAAAGPVRRIGAGGWTAGEAEDCRRALEEFRHAGYRFQVASRLLDCSFIRWGSAESRVAHQDVVESLAVLVDGRTDNPYLSFARWLSEFTLPWSLLFLGEWGEALRTLAAAIALADKNGDRYRAQTLQLYRAWVHLHAMDSPEVLKVCNSVLPALDGPARSRLRRFCLLVAAFVHGASLRYAMA